MSESKAKISPERPVFWCLACVARWALQPPRGVLPVRVPALLPPGGPPRRLRFSRGQDSYPLILYPLPASEAGARRPKNTPSKPPGRHARRLVSFPNRQRAVAPCIGTRHTVGRIARLSRPPAAPESPLVPDG